MLIGFGDTLDEEDIEALDQAFEPYRARGIEIGFMDGVTSMVVVRPGEETRNEV